MNDVEYAGFWVRTGAALIDTILMLIIILPILIFIYGQEYLMGDSFLFGLWDLLFSYILPAIAVILFWAYKSATHGKMILKLSIVDAKTGDKPSTGQLIGRYFAYYVSTIPLFLGIIWVGIDKRKQGWHDKIAGTVVIKSTAKQYVQFKTQVEQDAQPHAE